MTSGDKYCEPIHPGPTSQEIPAPGTSRPPVQIHIHQYDECAKATVQNSKGELELGTAELAQAECDCRISALGSAIQPPSRLLAELQRRAKERGRLALAGRSWEVEAVRPFGV